MGETFFPARGCVYTVSSSGAGRQSGFYSIDELKSSGSTIILLQGIDYEQTDIVQPVLTLDDTQILYAFAKDFGRIGVSGEILLGPAGSASGAGLAAVLSFFEKNRVVKTKKTIKVSRPDSGAFPVYLTGLTVGRVDPEFHVQPFILSGLVASK